MVKSEDHDFKIFMSRREIILSFIRMRKWKVQFLWVLTTRRSSFLLKDYWTHNGETFAASCDECLPSTWHKLSRVKISETGNDYQELTVNETQQRTRGGRQYFSSSVSVVYPELIVMVDYSLYQKFRYSLSATHQYVISYFNTVNFRYLDMNECLWFVVSQVQISVISQSWIEFSWNFHRHIFLLAALPSHQWILLQHCWCQQRSGRDGKILFLRSFQSSAVRSDRGTDCSGHGSLQVRILQHQHCWLCLCWRSLRQELQVMRIVLQWFIFAQLFATQQQQRHHCWSFVFKLILNLNWWLF